MFHLEISTNELINLGYKVNMFNFSNNNVFNNISKNLEPNHQIFSAKLFKSSPLKLPNEIPNETSSKYVKLFTDIFPS